MNKWKMKKGNTTRKSGTTIKTITKNKTYKITAIIISVILMFNLSAIVDHFFHPRIPYFDEEHIIVGCATGLFSIAFLIIAYFYFYYQRKFEEELFRTVLNNAPITIFATDSQGIFTLSEGKGLERAGLKPGDNVGVSAFDLYNFLPFMEKTGKATNGKDVINRALAGESVIAFSLLFGVHFENHIGPLLDRDGNIAGIVGVATDITERKIAEVALRESEEKYRNLVENLGKEYFFYRHDRYGVFTYVSNSMTEMLGYSIQEFLTHHTEYHTNNPINKEAVKRTELSIQGQQQSPYEIEVYHKDKSIIRLEVTEIPLFDYNREVYAIEGIAKNITERKLAEEKLRILSSRQQAILTSVPDIIMEVDDNKIYTWANAAGLEFFGDEVIGKEASLYFEGEQETYNIVKPLFIGSENIIYVESWQRRKDGKKRLLAWCCKVLKDENGKVTGALSSAQDITERNQAERQIQYQANLLENVSDAILATDRQFNIQYWNTAAEKQYGWTSAEVLGKHFTLFIKPNYLSESRKTVMQKILQNGYWSGELLHNRHDGTLFPVLVTISEVKNAEGHVVGHITVNRDITERKLAEKELHKSEEKYRALFDTASDAVFLVDQLAGNILDVNSATTILYGYTRDELCKMNVRDVSTQPDTTLKAIQSEETNIPIRYHKKKNGSIFPVEIRNSVFSFDNQKITVGFIRDITERKLAEEELRESEEKYRKLVEFSPDALLIHIDGIIQFVNKASVKLFDADSKGNLIGKEVINLVHHDYRKIVRQRIGKIIDEKVEVPMIEEKLVTLKGVVFDAEVTAIPISLMGQNGVQVIARDITERKLAEKKLKESQEKIQKILDASPEAIWMINLDGTIADCNKTTLNLYGCLTKEDLLGKSGYNLVVESERPRAMKLMQEILTREIMHGVELTMLRMDCSQFISENAGSVLRNPLSGEPIGLVVLTKDITERKNAEEELQHVHDQLLEAQRITHGGSWEADFISGKLVWSDEMYRIYGVDRESFGHTREALLELIHPDDRHILQDSFQRIFSGKQNLISHQFRIIHPDGSIHYVESSNKAYFDSCGKPVRVIGATQDITERKLAQEEVQYLAKFPSENPGPILRIAQDGKLLYVNEAGLKQLPDWKLQIKQSAPIMLLDVVFNTINTGAVQIAEFGYREKVYSFYIAPIVEAGYANLYGRDITERKLAEEKLLASEVRYRRLFESAKDGILILDANTGKILDVNPFLANLLGYSKIELTGKNVWEIGFLENIVSNQNKFFELQKKKYVRYEDLPLKTTDGRKINVEFVSNVYLVNNQEVIQCNIRDITERKTAEEEIKESKNQLENLYKRLNDIRENERAEISREIHDELGQSLTALKMDLNWTKENLTDKILAAKKFNSMIDIVSETIKKVQRISAALRPGMLDDLGLIPAVQWYGQEFEERTGLKCNFDLKELPAHNSQINLTLFRIFQEGLTNIIRHANAKSVDVKLYSSSGNIILKIKDDGIGTEQEKINSKESLGLLGMKERIKQFNGSLEIISSENKGTSLIVSIPIIN